MGISRPRSTVCLPRRPTTTLVGKMPLPLLLYHQRELRQQQVVRKGSLWHFSPPRIRCECYGHSLSHIQLPFFIIYTYIYFLYKLCLTCSHIVAAWIIMNIMISKTALIEAVGPSAGSSSSHLYNLRSVMIAKDRVCFWSEIATGSGFIIRCVRN